MAEIAVSLVIDKLIPFLANRAAVLSGVHREINDIKDELEAVRAFLQSADARADSERSNGVAKVWVNQVRQVAFRIEDVIDEYTFHLAEKPQHRGVAGFFRRVTRRVILLPQREDMVSQIQEIKPQFEEIRQRAKRYNFSLSEQGSGGDTGGVPVASLYSDDDDIVGIESIRKELTEKLVAEELRRAVIWIVGRGGQGKTTLARKVYESQIKKGPFDCYAWVPLSQSYKLGDFQSHDKEELLRSTIKGFCASRKETVPDGVDSMKEMELTEKLNEYLQPKRYAVVFDDVCTIEFWRFIKHVIPNNNKGSRIIITTRYDNVASSCEESSVEQICELKGLCDDEARKLFCKKAFQSGKCPEDLERWSRKIVEKCEGLPLAIVAIAGLLLSRRSEDELEWIQFYNGLGHELRMSPHLTNVTKIIFLSYHDLPYYLKSCFLYLCILPEGVSIECRRLIRLWIAEGFVQTHQGKTLEDVAEVYLTELKNRSLVQVSNVSLGSHLTSCRVHDLLREIMVFKSEEFSFCQVVREDTSFLRQSRRLSIHNNLRIVVESTNNSSIRSCFLFRVDKLPKPLLCGLFEKFKFLKVLDLEGTPLDYLPKRVGKLCFLTYLSVAYTKMKALPKSIGKLENLQTLNLVESPVTELPFQIRKLRMLRHLLAYKSNYRTDLRIDSFSGVKIVKGVEHLGKLQELQELQYVEANGEELIKMLENSTQLRRLGITNLRKKDGSDLCAAIQQMAHLMDLDVRAESEDGILDLQSISPVPQNLHHLALTGQLGKLPGWIPQLQRLVSLGLHFSRLTVDPLKDLQAFSNLLTLDLQHGYDGESLHFEAGGFKKLKVLNLTFLKKLKSLTIEEGALPSLEELSIGPSPLLKEVPSGIGHLNKLRDLGFFDMPKIFIERMKPDKNLDYGIVQNIPRVLYSFNVNGSWEAHKLSLDPSICQSI